MSIQISLFVYNEDMDGGCTVHTVLSLFPLCIYIFTEAMDVRCTIYIKLYIFIISEPGDIEGAALSVY